MRINGQDTKNIEPKHLVYPIALHLIQIENGRDVWKPESEMVRELLQENQQSCIKAVNHQDMLDKHEAQKSAEKDGAPVTEESPDAARFLEKPTLPLIEILKMQITADSERLETEIDPSALATAVSQALDEQISGARKKGQDIAETLIAQKVFPNIDKMTLNRYITTLALEAIGAAEEIEISLRQQIQQTYPTLPTDINAAEALKRPVFTDRANIRSGTVTPAGAAASKPTGSRELP